MYALLRDIGDWLFQVSYDLELEQRTDIEANYIYMDIYMKSTRRVCAKYLSIDTSSVDDQIEGQ